MQSMTDALGAVFRSQRLEYRALETTEASKRHLDELLLADPTVRGLATLKLLRPLSRADTDEELESRLKGQLLTVTVCLPAGSAPAGAPGSVEGEPTVIGVVSLSRVDETYQHHRATSIGIRIGAPYQNKGYGAEAINWVLDWAFKWANMHRVDISTASYNDRALALYRKLGFVQEGIRRKVFYANGEWHDEHLMGMLEDEWRALRASK